MPRGADVRLRVKVQTNWLEDAATVELELPRNLECAACDGGGCDRCERSGAISIRGRKEPAELLRVTLPRRAPNLETTGSGRSIVVRVPGRGGLAEDETMPRGILMLQLVPSDSAGPGVRRIEPEAALPEAAQPGPAPAAPNWRLILLVVVILWILLLIWLRLSGRG